MNSLCSVTRSGSMATARPLLAMASRPATLSLAVWGNVSRPTSVISATTTTLRLESLRTKTYRHPQGASRAELDAIQKTVNPGPKDLGEKIYLWNHIQANYILWSTTRELRSNKALRQVQFTGKKITLIKLRKDYWRPMATIQFPLGQGEAGLSVYQKLLELKKRHELEWDDGSEEAQRLLNMTKIQRGRELNDQKGNSVADLAFILGGGGKGNKIVKNFEEIREWRVRRAKGGQGEDGEEVVDEVKEGEGEVVKEEAAKGEEGKEEAKEEEEEEVEEEEEEDEIEERRPLGEEPAKELHKVRVFWAHELDHHFAESWSDNVEHVLGLPKEDWTSEDLDEMVANQERLVELHAVLRKKKLEEREKKAERRARLAAKKAEYEQRFAPTPEGENGWKSRPRAPKPFTGKAPKWAKEGL